MHNLKEKMLTSTIRIQHTAVAPLVLEIALVKLFSGTICKENSPCGKKKINEVVFTLGMNNF